jgi:hypothetical protein
MGTTFAAGLVVPRSTVALTALAPSGATLWTRDVVSGVSWTPNATLNVLPTAMGAIVVWSGPQNGKEATVAIEASNDGKTVTDPFPVGPAACTTDIDLAWAERGEKDSWKIRVRRLAGTTSGLAMVLSEDREPSLFCSPHRVFLFGDGDDDVTLSSWSAGTHTLPIRVMEDSEFGDDEERGHEIYAVEDVLGVVRFGASGSVAAREVNGDHRSAWRRFGHKLTESDDVILVDADAHTVVVGFTRDASGSGDVAGQTSVNALVWDRTESHDATLELAPPDPARVRGPFWSGAVKGGIVVAWPERSATSDGGEAPVLGLSYRVVSLGPAGELKRITRPADDLVDAGCDNERCYAVALARALDEDGGQPEVAEVIAYP